MNMCLFALSLVYTNLGRGWLPNWWVKIEVDKKHLEVIKMFECYLNYKTRSSLQPWEWGGQYPDQNSALTAESDDKYS